MKFKLFLNTRPRVLVIAIVLRDTDHLIVLDREELVRLCFSFVLQFFQELFISHPFFYSSIRADIDCSTALLCMQ